MIGVHHSENRTRARWVIILRWLAAVAAIGILLCFLPLDLLSQAMRRIPLTTFLWILFGYLCAHAVGIAKWRMVVNTAGGKLDFRTSAQCYTGGLFGTLFLPSIIGGDLVRLAVGLRRSPRPAAVLAGNVVDRAIDVAAQATLVLAGLLLLPGSLPAEFRAPARRVLVLAALIAAVLLLLLAVLSKPLLTGRSRRFRRRLARFVHALRSVRRRPGRVFVAWLLGVLIQ